MIHFWTSGSRYLLCGDEIGPETVSARPQDVTCPACRDILDEHARGTVQRTMYRRLMVQAQAAVANDVLWRVGYPLPDGLPPSTIAVAACSHARFGASVEVNRLSDDDGGPVTGYSADIRIRCAECGLPFEFIGLPAGLSPSQPTSSFAGDELRVPIKPMAIGVAARLADG